MREFGEIPKRNQEIITITVVGVLIAAVLIAGLLTISAITRSNDNRQVNVAEVCESFEDPGLRLACVNQVD